MERQEVGFATDGERCAASLCRPSPASAPVPCVVMGSGLSCVRDQGLDAFAERFAAAGIAALAFDFRAALAAARSLDGVDPGRLVLWGYSLGGANVQAVAATEPGIAAAICVAPVVSGLRSLLHIGGPAHLARLGWAGARDGVRALRGSEPFRIAAAGPPGSLAALSSPDSAPGFAAITPPGSTWRNELCARVALAPPYRLARKVGRIECPILYCITEDDDVNPPRLGRLAARRAPRGELRLYPGGHYDPFQGETFERVVADQVGFLRHHLGARPPRAAS